jgi:hypothetical protein
LRLVPYLAVFVLGALLVLGAGLGLSYLGGLLESRGEIEQRLVALHERAAALELKQELGSRSLAALEARFGTAEADSRRASAAVLEVEKTLAARPAAAAADGDGTASEPVDLGPFAARLDVIEKKLEENAGAADTARAQAAIVAGRLVQEVERGAPYLHELDALVAFGVDESALAPLRAGADTGVASPQRLSEEFAQLAPAILASEHEDGDAGIAERLKGYASHLVQIERLDERESKTVRGLVARIEAALGQGQIADAYALWNELPEAAQASSESFGTSAKKRLDASGAARALESSTLAAIGKPKS